MPWVTLSDLQKVMKESEKVEVTTRFLKGMDLPKQTRPDKSKKPQKKLEFTRY